MNTRLSQIIVYVSDMRRSVAFYRDILELKVLAESDQWSEFEAGPFHLALHWSSAHEEMSGQVRVPAGRAELVFEVGDLEKACQEIKARGGAIEGPMTMEGLDLRVAFLRDPDGMAIELIE